MDMLWPPGDLAISISAHNSETEPEPRVLMGRNSEKRPASRSYQETVGDGKPRASRSGRRQAGRRSPIPLVLPQSAISSTVQHVGLLRTGNAALRLRIEPELRNSRRLAPSSNA